MPNVRLIDDEGNNFGVISTSDALDRAADAGLDLVEVSPNVDPPVCKIMDFGKFKYEQQKKANEARKQQIQDLDWFMETLRAVRSNGT